MSSKPMSSNCKVEYDVVEVVKGQAAATLRAFLARGFELVSHAVYYLPITPPVAAHDQRGAVLAIAASLEPRLIITYSMIFRRERAD